MSQNDPLLGNDWLDKESDQLSVRAINGLVMNGNPLTAKTNLNHAPTADPMKAALNSSGPRPQVGYRLRPGDKSHQQLMSAIAMSSSDSSSDDIVIPMQKRKLKPRYRKRRSRSTDSNLSIKSRALISCPSICLKVVLTLLVISSILFTIAFMAKLYDRIDSLQTAINDLSMSGNSVPQEMHSIHSHLKTLDTNVTAFGARLAQAVDRIDNLTKEVTLIKTSLAKLSDSVEAAPAIRQLPKELQALQKVVADLGSRMSTDDSEIQSIKKTLSNQLSSQSLNSDLAAIHSNISELYALMPNVSTLSAKAEHNSQQLAQLSDTLTNWQQMTTSLINWRAQAEHQLNFTLNMTQHIHEKLHNQSHTTGTGNSQLESGQSSDGSKSTASPTAQKLPHNKKQSSDDELTVSPVNSETSTPSLHME